MSSEHKGIAIGRDAQVTVGWGAPDEINVAQELLGEYSVKLRDMTTVYQQKAQSFALVLPLLLVAILIMAATLYSLFDLINVSLFIIFCSLVLVISIITSFYYTRTRAYLKSLKEEISIAKTELEKVVRITSQIEDHGKHTPSTRLKLQLRLTESESAMRLADDVLGTRHAHPYAKIDDQVKPRASYSDLPASSNAS